MVMGGPWAVSRTRRQGPVAGFERSQALFAGLVESATGEQALGLEHSQLEARLAADGRELARQVLQNQLDLRTAREQRLDGVIGSDGTPRRSVERGHERDLHTVLGEVQVTRLAHVRPAARTCIRLTRS
jgi:hypothetical protein